MTLGHEAVWSVAPLSHDALREEMGMNRRDAVVVTATVLAGAMLLSACGTNRTEGSANASGSCDTSKGTLVIGMIAPMSGGLSAIGLGMRNSADLAIEQASENCAVPGYRLAFMPEDDQSTPQVAAQAARSLPPIRTSQR